MSWACAFTGLTSMFNDRQRIGVISSTPNPATAIDFMNVAVQQDLRTIFVEPGTEQAVAAAVAKACERKEVHPVDFKYIVALKSNDHMTDEYLEQKVKQSCALLNVAQLDLVLCPWPVAPSPNGMEDFDRKERNRQAVRMRKTWDKLCSLKSTLTMGEVRSCECDTCARTYFDATLVAEGGRAREVHQELGLAGGHRLAD